MDTPTIILDTLEMFVNDHPEIEESFSEMTFGPREVTRVSRMVSTNVSLKGEEFEIIIIPK